jgi:hypothetical protein
MTIPIYANEIDMAEEIQAKACFTYASQVDLMTKENIQRAISNKLLPNLMVAKGSINDIDLYYTKSILVTSNWNKNDDVFTAADIWAARHTPAHKPTNINHDEHKVVGHITDNWAIDADGNIIPDDTEASELPGKFHIVNGAVIYTNWTDEELQERTQKLISAIEEGKKYVSMECLFTNFDYALQNADGSYEIIKRNDETSWMTKALRAYGGSGKVEKLNNRTIGRVLRNITFCGKGYVDKPANSESIIFSDASDFNENQDSGVLISIEPSSGSLLTTANGENNMSEITQAQYDELKQQSDKTAAELIKERDVLIKANLALTEESEAAKTAKKEDEKKMSDMKTKCEELEASLLSVKAELDAMKIAEAKASRISTLVDGGIAKDNATAKVEIFASLNDEQFNVIAKELIEADAAKKVIPAKKEDKSTTCADNATIDTAESTATEQVLDTAKAEETPAMNIVTEVNVDTKEEVRKSIAEMLSVKRNNKQ